MVSVLFCSEYGKLSVFPGSFLAHCSQLPWCAFHIINNNDNDNNDPTTPTTTNTVTDNDDDDDDDYVDDEADGF